jgi:succinoglycan biosynthesis transport protein ExoP
LETASDTTPALAAYVRPVWERKWLVILVVLLATAGTYAYNKRKPKVYEAGTLVYYSPATNPLSGGQTFTTDRTVEDVAALLYSQGDSTAVAKLIHYPGSPGALVSQVTISARPGEDFVAISASSATPQEAALIANGYARQLVTNTNDDQQTTLNQQISGLRKQLSHLGNTTPDDQATRLTVTSQITTLQSALQSPTGTRQVSPAAPPSAPVSPKPVQDALFAFVLSLALAIAAAFGLERFDRRLKQPEDVAREYGLPLIAALPHVAEAAASREAVVALAPEFHEAFSLLRTNIHLLTLDATPRTIAVVSAMPGEGKSTVVRNLAIAMAEAGNRVAVVEADLRRPVLSSLMGMPATLGLTDVLTGAVALGDVLSKVPIRAPGVDMLADMGGASPDITSTNGHSAAEAISAISVLLAGTHPPNPATVLESDRVTEVFDTLKDMFDVLIMDSAPMLSVTDAVPLVRYADATVVVGRVNLTTRDNIRRMTSFLARMPDAHVLGVIANDVTEAASYGAGYGYYGYGYRTVDPSKPGLPGVAPGNKV